MASAVPCLVRPRSGGLSSHISARDAARRNISPARIYFSEDPVPGPGIGTRNRILVNGNIYAVQDVTNPNSLDRIIEVDCEAISNA